MEEQARSTMMMTALSLRGFINLKICRLVLRNSIEFLQVGAHKKWMTEQEMLCSRTTVTGTGCAM